VQLAYLWTPFSTQTLVLSENLGVLLTVTWVVVVVNAVNLLDGLDGLAAGMTAIAASAFFVYVIRSGSLFGPASPAALLSVVTVGIAVGFLPWNFFPAKIFMGDTGSMLLGMLLAIATISGVNGNPIKPTGRDLAALAGPLIVTLLILFIPFLDVVLAVARRTWRREAIGAPDKEHLHHRLLDVGHTQRRAVLLMYLWSALISGGALAIGLVRGRFAVGMILLGAVLLILATALPRLTRENGGNGGNGGDGRNGASGANGESGAEKPSPSEASSP
jgi:UDP-GlcNAc:undecaprenyl-phosphate GlcNAc-1-phosphate transferase